MGVGWNTSCETNYIFHITSDPQMLGIKFYILFISPYFHVNNWKCIIQVDFSPLNPDIP